MAPEWSRWRWRRISMHERLFLNPFDKCARFGIFPTKFILHLLLLILVTWQVMMYLRKDIKHACHTGQHFSTLFLGTSQGPKVIMEPEHLRRDFEQVVRNIFLINDVTFNDVKLVMNGSADPDDLLIAVRFRNQTLRLVHLSRDTFLSLSGSAAYLSQMIPSLYTQGVKQLQDISVSFGLNETVHNAPSEQEHFASQFFWNITVQFDGSYVGRFVGTLSYSMGTDGKLDHQVYRLNICIIAAASLCLLLIARRVAQTLYVLWTIRSSWRPPASDKSPGASSILSMQEEMALFNWWWAVSALSHVMQLAATAKSMTKTSDVTDRFMLLGWSSFLTWFNICQYYESFPGLYLTFSTTRQGMASVCRYMASVVPILTAFMFLGTCNFWKASTFQDVSASYASLFSLLNGDMVHDAFNDLGGVGGWAGYLYVYVFIFIFIYIVLNVNITIIEEAYFAARAKGLKHEQQVQMARAINPSTPLTPRDVWHSENLGAARDTNFEQPLLLPGVQPHVGAPDWGWHSASSSSGASPSPGRSGLPGGEQPPPFPLRGPMSPRLLDNPRLAGALLAVFPAAEGTTPKRVKRRATTALCAVQEHRAADQVLPAQALHPGPEGAAAAAATAAALEQWFTELPQWTQQLQEWPLPRRSQIGEERWRELETCVAAHAAVISEVTAQLYNEAVRT